MAAPAASVTVDIFLAFMMMCRPSPEGVAGAGTCAVTPPNDIYTTKTLCDERLRELKQAYSAHPELAEYTKLGGRLYFGCYKTNSEAGPPSVHDVVKEFRK